VTLALLAGGTCIFVAGELLPVGLLSAISDDLHVSVGATGRLVTAYAGVVVVTAIPLTALSSDAPRKGLLLGLLAVQAAGSALAAVAPSYPLLLAARVLGAFAHGVFWSIIAALAARLAAGGAGRATAAVFSGNSVAVVLGVPAATLLGQQAGWRASFAALALIGAGLLIAATRVMPRLAAEGRNDLGSIPTVLAGRRLRTSRRCSSTPPGCPHRWSARSCSSSGPPAWSATFLRGASPIATAAAPSTPLPRPRSRCSPRSRSSPSTP
jgi:DHA1 family inner membrane transport protein